MSKFLKLNAVCFNGKEFYTENIVVNSDFIIGFYPECNIEEGEKVEDFCNRTLTLDASMILIKKELIEIVDYQCERFNYSNVINKFRLGEYCPAKFEALCEGSNYLWVTNSDGNILEQLNGNK